jgi:Esterase-like activity of phytase
MPGDSGCTGPQRACLKPARTGEPAIMLNPWVRIAGLDGSLGEFTMPPGSNISAAGDAGPRPNQSLEGLTLSPNGRFLFAAMEDPRYEDGPTRTTITQRWSGSPSSTSSREPLSPNMLTR